MADKKEYYDLKTIEDFLAVVREDNIEVLIADFKQFLQLYLDIKKVNGSFEKGGLGKIDFKPFMRWIDDGNSGIKKIQFDITIKTEDDTNV